MSTCLFVSISDCLRISANKTGSHLLRGHLFLSIKGAVIVTPIIWQIVVLVTVFFSGSINLPIKELLKKSIEVCKSSKKQCLVCTPPPWGLEYYIICFIYIDLSMLRCFHSNHWPPRWPDMVSWIFKQKICITKSLPSKLFQCCK